MMGNTHEQLTHDEIWDDSALIDSWNDALDEYKKYHSIHAKGGHVPIQNPAGSAEPSVKQQPAHDASNGQQTDTDEAQTTEQGPADIAMGGQDSFATQNTDPERKPQVAHPPVPPQAVLGSMQDENLKKLLMSWYYAGYYTGLYEGQQQSQRSSQP